MQPFKLREELLAAFARMDADDRARASAALAASCERPQPTPLDPRPGDDNLPFEPDPQHTATVGSVLRSEPRAQLDTPLIHREPTAMETTPVITAAFIGKYPQATSIRVIHQEVWTAGTKRILQLPSEVWIALPDGTVVIEKGYTADQLLERAARRDR